MWCIPADARIQILFNSGIDLQLLAKALELQPVIPELKIKEDPCDEQLQDFTPTPATDIQAQLVHTVSLMLVALKPLSLFITRGSFVHACKQRSEDD